MLKLGKGLNGRIIMSNWDPLVLGPASVTVFYSMFMLSIYRRQKGKLLKLNCLRYCVLTGSYVQVGLDARCFGPSRLVESNLSLQPLAQHKQESNKASK